MNEGHERRQRRKVRRRATAATTLDNKLGVLRRVLRLEVATAGALPAGWRERLSTWFYSLRGSRGAAVEVAAPPRAEEPAMLTLLRAEAPPVRLVLEGAGARGGLSEWRLLNATPAALWLLFVETSTEGQRTVLPEDNFAEAPRIEAGETFVFALGAARSARLERLLVLGFESPPQGHVSQLFDPLDALEQLQPRAVATLEVRREG